MTSLTHHQQIYNGFQAWNLPLYFSKPVLRHLMHAVDGMSSLGFTGKLTEIHAASHHPKHRTTLGHFLKNSPWEESFLQRQMKQKVHQKLRKDEPAFAIIDDTISEKTKPLSRATSPTEACGFHFSHTVGKSVFGHQVVQLMVSDKQTAYPYDFSLYHKEEAISKIELAIQLLRQIPDLQRPTYVLCDSWYTSKTIIESALTQGHHLIGALKTNRILYPQGVRMQAKQFAAYIEEGDTDLVTIGSESYRVYRYEGALNDIDVAVVLLCWPTNEPMKANSMRCFLSTDTELTNETILTYYGVRWRIETYFQQVKGQLGFQGVQVRSKRAILRYWLLVQFAYLFLCDLHGTVFTQTIHHVRRCKFASIIEFVHVATTNGVSLQQIKNELQVA